MAVVEALRGQNLFDHVMGLREKAARLAEQAEARGDIRGATAALKEVRECDRLLIEAQAKADEMQRDADEKEGTRRALGLPPLAEVEEHLKSIQDMLDAGEIEPARAAAMRAGAESYVKIKALIAGGDTTQGGLSPEIVALLLKTLMPHPEARQALAKALQDAAQS